MCLPVQDDQVCFNCSFVLQCFALCCSELRCAVVSLSVQDGQMQSESSFVLHCSAACCSVLRCVAMGLKCSFVLVCFKFIGKQRP